MKSSTIIITHAITIFGFFPAWFPTEASSDEAVATDPVVDEVLAEIIRRPVGDHSVAVLNLPEPFLRRAADRIVRSSYQERYHIVVRDEGGPDHSNSTTQTASSSRPAGRGSEYFAISRHEPAGSVRAFRNALFEQRPPLRGFRAPILEWVAETHPIQLPRDMPPNMRRAAAVVARRLAFDGLVATLAQAVEKIGPTEFAGMRAERAEALWAIGLPVDLLAVFRPPGGNSEDALAIVDYVTNRLSDGETAESMRDALQAMPFEFRPAHAGFHVATESGEHDVGAVRLQLTRGTYWGGIGAGGCLDMARQLVENLPNATFLASIEEKHLETFKSVAAGWKLRRPDRLTLLPEPLAVSQWAQDNGKSGILHDEGKGRSVIATLVPRYASRGEDGSMFVPGESFLMDGVAAAGMTVIQSPLLFQGGNLLAVREPDTGERVLLIGEAEVYRNTALGLSFEQVLLAFRVEFAVDRCIVLPAVSFHIDFDVSLRVCDGRLTAFVNDSATAARIVLQAGIDALEKHGVLDEQSADAARNHVSADRPAEFLGIVGPAVGRRTNARRQFPESFANLFAIGPMDSPVGNLRCFLLAMDTFVHEAITPNDRHARSYIRSFARRERERRQLAALFSAQGWRVVAVPSLADGNRSINFLNGLHTRGRYLMPAYGGLYQRLDAAAAGVFRREFGDEVEVIPVLSGESQRRAGALHCSASVYPQL